jgi:hypothetical protein
MRKRRFPFGILIMFIFIILVAFAAWEVFEYRARRELPEETKDNSVGTPEKPNGQEGRDCQPSDLSNYEIARIDSKSLEYKIDLNGDTKEEIVRVYNQITETGARNLPIILKILSGPTDCLKEDFTYTGRKDPNVNLYENEIADFQILPNFWGEGRNAIMLLGEQTAYGSGFTIYTHFLTFKDGKYLNIDGPELNELSNFKFKNEDIKGKDIIVARAIWAEDEAHFDNHRYQFEIYSFDGEKYIEKDAGATKNKYLGDIGEMLEKEPEILLSP